ncbi:MAG: hydrogenase expression/formation protein HypE [bacterium]|nr:hydrogenase expression/formation protein HypE [bacterium]
MLHDETILLDHGEGGAATARLVEQLFFQHFGSSGVPEDATILPGAERIAITTDSFVVRPVEFPGGDIGKLSVCGTVNDLVVMGAIPQYLTAGFLLEEGLEIALLDRIVASMSKTAQAAGVRIVAGDTKVVGKGDADRIFINTTGIGFVPEQRLLSSASCQPGDVILISGSIGEHGIAVMVARESFGISGDLVSDCQPLHDLAEALLDAVPTVRCMRDPTRGGVATTLLEIATASKVGMELREEYLPIRRPVQSACDLLGLDPLYVACEGRFLAVVPPEAAERALQALRNHPKGAGAQIIGEVVDFPKKLLLKTRAGGKRPLIALEGAQLPRIC